MTASNLTADAIPQSKGWFSLDRKTVSTAIVATILTGMARTYGITNDAKVKDYANLLVLPVFMARDKLDDELYWKTGYRGMGDVACGVAACVIARVFMGDAMMYSKNWLWYGAAATSSVLVARYLIEDNPLKI